MDYFLILLSFESYLLYYYDLETKREVNRRLIHECRCDERLKTKGEGSTRLAYTGLSGGLEHLKIETRLRDERIESVNRGRTRHGGSGTVSG